MRESLVELLYKYDIGICRCVSGRAFKEFRRNKV